MTYRSPRTKSLEKSNRCTAVDRRRQQMHLPNSPAPSVKVSLALLVWYSSPRRSLTRDLVGVWHAANWNPCASLASIHRINSQPANRILRESIFRRVMSACMCVCVWERERGTFTHAGYSNELPTVRSCQPSPIRTKVLCKGRERIEARSWRHCLQRDQSYDVDVV